MLKFTEFLLEKDIEFDEKKHRWITIKDKKMQNQHIMIKKKDGTIVAGMGGKHTGDTLDDVYDGDNKNSSKGNVETSKVKNDSDKNKSVKSSSKKPSKKEIKNSITDESLKSLKLTIAATTNSYGDRSRLDTYSSDISHYFGKLPKLLQDSNSEEYESIKKDIKKFKKSRIDIMTAYSLAEKLKNDKKLSTDEKELLNNAIENGGVDKLIDNYNNQYDEIKSSVKSFVSKCKKLKNDYDSSPEGEKVIRDNAYASDFNWAGKWKPEAPYGGYWREYDWEYNEKTRREKLENALYHLKNDIKKAGGSADISLERGKKITINKDGSYLYNGKSVNNEEVLKLLQKHKEVSVDTKFDKS